MRPVRPPLATSSPALDRRRLLGAGALAPLTSLGALASLGLGACAPRAPLRIAGHPWPGYEPMFLARGLGYLPSSIELVESATLQDSVEMTRAGQVDGAMLTLDEVLQLRDQGLSLQVVLVFDISRGADTMLVRPGIDTLAELRGKRIGLEDTALGSLMLTLILERAGLTERDVMVRRVPYERHEAVWLQQSLDALITYEPVSGRLLGRQARVLVSTRDLPETIFDVLAVNASAIEQHGPALRDGVQSYFRALRYQRRNPWDAAYRCASRLQITAEAMIESLRGLEQPDQVGNQRYLSGTDNALVRTALRLSPIMLQAGLIRNPVHPRHLVTSELLPT